MGGDIHVFKECAMCDENLAKIRVKSRENPIRVDEEIDAAGGWETDHPGLNIEGARSGRSPGHKQPANIRSGSISVIDLAMAIGNPPLNTDEDPFIILTEYNRRTQGFLVGSVDRIVNMTWGEIMSPPKGTGGDSYMTAVTEVEKELVQIIDVEKVLKEIVGTSEVVSDGIIEEEVRNEVQQVLVVDDSSVARNQVKRVLDQLGIETTLFKDGKEALDQLLAWHEEGKSVPDFLSMVISDIEMPRMDGYTLTTEIRKHPQLAKLFIVLHTSLSGVFNEAMVQRVGADHFLAKYVPDELAETVQKQIKAHMAERA